MKKFLSISTMFAILICTCFVFAGCKPTLTKINVDLTTIKTEYYIGEEQETYENAKVYAIYSDYSQKLISSSDEELEFSQISTDHIGEQTLTVSYKGKTQEIKININQRLDKEISNIEIVEESVSKVEYNIDEAVYNYLDLEVTLTFADGTDSVTVLANSLSGLTVTLPESDTIGTSYLTVSYQNKTDSVAISIIEKEIESLTLFAQNAKFVKGENFPKADVSVIVNYTDDTHRVITKDNASYELVTFNIDLNTSGYQNFTASYKGITSNTLENTPVYSTIYDSYYITEFSAPEFVSKYEANKARTAAQQPFKVTDEGYVIGHLNAFKFMPIISGCASLEDISNITSIPKYKSFVTIQEYVSGSWSDPITENLNTIVTIDDENSTLWFTEGAINRTFKITVQPYFDRSVDNTVSFEFTVQNGYNIYNVKELSLIDNVNTTSVIEDNDTPNGVWSEFKNSNNLNFTVNGGVYLHCDLTLTKEDVASGYFFTSTQQIPNDGDWSTPTHWEGSVFEGSLIDETYIYKRAVAAGEKFNINGNYFSINASAFPLISCFKNWGSDSNNFTHGAMLWTEGLGEVNISNLELFGNANKSEREKSGGGLTFVKVSRDSKTTIDNVQAKAFFISFFAHESSDDLTTMNINNSIATDNFSNIIFSHGKTSINIKNSTLKNSGGPLFIVSHDDPDEASDANNEGLLYGTISLDKDCIIENFVTGQEAWFVINNATGIVNAVKQLNAAFTGTGKAIYRTTTYNGEPLEELNLIGLVMNEDGPLASLSTGSINGKISMETETDGIKEEINMVDDPYFLAAQAYPAPILQAGGQTLMYAGTEVGIRNVDQSAPTNEQLQAFLSANYLGLSHVLKLTNDESTPGRTGILFGFFSTVTA